MSWWMWLLVAWTAPAVGLGLTVCAAVGLTAMRRRRPRHSVGDCRG